MLPALESAALVSIEITADPVEQAERKFALLVVTDPVCISRVDVSETVIEIVPVVAITLTL